MKAWGVVDGQVYEVPIELSEVTVGLVILPLVSVQDTEREFSSRPSLVSHQFE
jgi:hypothetical protein